MSSLFAQDTARNTLAKWASNGVSGGYLLGAYISPFAQPPVGNGYKIDVEKIAEALSQVDGEFWFDPTTHALDMPRVGDFRYYDNWDLWVGDRGDLSTDVLRQEHVKRVFRVQKDLGCDYLGPSVLLSNPDSPKSQLALEVSKSAVGAEADAWLTIAGDTHFWQAGAELDAHIGALDQLEPGGWLLSVARAEPTIPVGATPEEVFGLMRTTYALSRDRRVRVAYGDIAALPAIAAGAEALGTGWDIRQRVCSYHDFEERVSASDGGGWYQRPTLGGLLGSLSLKDFQVLLSERPALAARLTPGVIGPKPEEAFRHHCEVLDSACSALQAEPSIADRCSKLEEMYVAAAADWAQVQSVTGANFGAVQWVEPFLAGVRMFIAAEGW